MLLTNGDFNTCSDTNPKVNINVVLQTMDMLRL